MAGEDGYFYEVDANNDRVLSMKIEGSHSGCGLHITRRLYNIDAQTGSLVGLNKLFGNDGRQNC